MICSLLSLNIHDISFMLIRVFLTKLKHSLLHPTTNTCYNSVIPDFIHHPGCVINKKDKFEHGEVGITWSINPQSATMLKLFF